jgi:hypothetical protein
VLKGFVRVEPSARHSMRYRRPSKRAVVRAAPFRSTHVPRRSEKTPISANAAQRRLFGSGRSAVSFGGQSPR